jgi:acetyltransferase-like isoleucine patch superfamily enzyme
MTETHAPCAIILGPSARRADERHGASRSPPHPRGRLHPLRCVRFLRPIDRKQRPEQPTVHASSRTDQHAPTGTPAAMRRRTEPMRLTTVHPRGGLLVRLVRRAITEARNAVTRLRGARIGRGVFIGCAPQLHGLDGIEIARGVNIGRRARIESHRTERGRATLSIGEGTSIGNDFHAGAAVELRIGRHCMFASGVTVLDHDHDFGDPSDPHKAFDAVVAQPTIIEDGVFLGDHVVVLKGVTIGRGSVIGANSVVTRDVPPLTIAAGMPARAIRTWNHTAARWDPVARAGTSSEAGVAA